MVKKILKSLSDIDFNSYNNEILTSLEDERIGVSNQAKRILIENKGLFDIDRVYEIYINLNIQHVRRNAAFILCNIGKWDALAYIIEVCSNNDKYISAIGSFALDKWKWNYNKSFTRPTNAQLEKINEALIKYNEYMNEDTVDWIRFVLKS